VADFNQWSMDHPPETDFFVKLPVAGLRGEWIREFQPPDPRTRMRGPRATSSAEYGND
jgi:hypothetical protein